MTTTYTHRFMVIPATNVACAYDVANKIADSKSLGSATGMWKGGLSATGTGTPTHYISSGAIDAQFAGLLGNAASTFSTYQAVGGVTYTLADITALYAALTIKKATDPSVDLNGNLIAYSLRDDAYGNEAACIAALGLKQIQGTI